MSEAAPYRGWRPGAAMTLPLLALGIVVVMVLLLAAAADRTCGGRDRNCWDEAPAGADGGRPDAAR